MLEERKKNRLKQVNGKSQPFWITYMACSETTYLAPAPDLEKRRPIKPSHRLSFPGLVAKAELRRKEIKQWLQSKKDFVLSKREEQANR
jgi:hypothetical protein